MKSLRLAIDFDNTIVEEEYPAVGKLIEGSKEYINKLYDDGHTITINTCRTGLEEGIAQTFLKEAGINYHWINCNRPEDIRQYLKDCRKISADVYIDDKNIGGIPPWNEIYDILTKIAEL